MSYPKGYLSDKKQKCNNERKAKIHNLKILPKHFKDVRSGRKLAEMRKNDRDFAVGDFLNLMEWTESGGFTGRQMPFHITHICDVGFAADGYVMISIAKNIDEGGVMKGNRKRR